MEILSSLHFLLDILATQILRLFPSFGENSFFHSLFSTPVQSSCVQVALGMEAVFPAAPP